MIQKILIIAMLGFGASFANAETKETSDPAKTCGQSSGPESMDPTIVEQMCLTDDGLEVTLRSGAVKNYAWVDFDPQDGEGVNVVTFSNKVGAKFSMILLTSDEGDSLNLEPIKDQIYPFHRAFSVRFK